MPNTDGRITISTFTGVLFENADFAGATFRGHITSFYGATFTGEYARFC